jgi:serine/threonine protein kinase
MPEHGDLEIVAREHCARHSLEFGERVGEGAFKQTFRVTSPDGVPRALKIYKPGSSTRRSQREIEAMRRCDHPNIAKLFSVESVKHAGQDFIATTEEYLAGGTLTARGTLTASDCAGIMRQLIEALSHIAELRLVHRDIKPDNIMFRGDAETAVLVDFGVVRDLSDSSITPSWAPRGPGTPFFAPPEQLNNEKHLLDWRADQFSLGIVACYVTLGVHPYRFAEQGPQQVVDRVSARARPSPDVVMRLKQLGLLAVPQMIEPWPVHRFRTPALLLQAWESQQVQRPS